MRQLLMTTALCLFAVPALAETRVNIDITVFHNATTQTAVGMARYEK